MDDKEAADKESVLQMISKSIPAHLGDVMSSRETFVSLSDEFTPMQRILLTANGNVQRILSAYYNAPVTVDILFNEKIAGSTENCIMFNRSVDIKVNKYTCCRATSTVSIYDPAYLKLVEEDGVGIGQLFRYLNILPEFQLLEVGRDDGVAGGVGGFWRRYILSAAGVKKVESRVYRVLE
ncbi:hypothetical protein SmJEL517_g02203 [Synchytrium microbalum]|uniref:Uncharacterized protein n=1 Tax=Synchytrium microbalum TaxID=1806994 RepID=A0A507CCT9_9FUNG|nr:uncharacterized protein SmJEL517_g02203 [Synchytrium microbalum]TPX35353.1 hypothetical protein SmJEL517_g02203 [Synchytrium microbalum]